MRTATIAIVSALVGGAIESTTKVFQNRIEPIVQSAACAVTEAFRRNTATDRFTAVVLSFDDDNEGATRDAIAQALSDIYSINAITTCESVALPASGNRSINIESARERLASLIEKYQADLVILGSVRNGDATVIQTGPRYLRTFGLYQGDKVDPSRIHEYIDSPAFFGNLLEHTETTAQSAGCVHPVYPMCNVGNRIATRRRLLDTLGRLHHIAAHYVNTAAWTSLYSSHRNAYSRIEMNAAAIAVFLRVHYDVRELPFDSLSNPLWFADLRLKMAAEYGVPTGDGASTPDTTIGRAVTSLVAAQTCGDAIAAEEALTRFGAGLEEARRARFQSRPFMIASLVRQGQAAAWLYALTSDGEVAEGAKTKLHETVVELSSAVGTDLANVFSINLLGGFLGEEYEMFRATYVEYISTEVAQLQRADVETSRDTVRRLLRPIAGCED